MENFHVDYSKVYYFYKEKEFRQILSCEFTPLELESFALKMIDWLTENVNITKVEPNGPLPNYRNSLNVNYTDVEIDYVIHVYNNIKSFLENNLLAETYKSDKKVQRSFVDIYLNFTASSADERYWFFKPTIFLTKNMFRLLCDKSKTFFSIANFALKDNSFGFLKKNFLNDYKFYSGDILEKISIELNQNKNKTYTEQENFIISLFNKENVMGFSTVD